MFDTIRCDLALPDDFAAEEFQSKSLDCTLAHYRITTEGRLLCTDTQQDTGFHGVLRFYDFDADNKRREYEAIFTEGQLVHLRTASLAQYDDAGFLLRP